MPLCCEFGILVLDEPPRYWDSGGFKSEPEDYFNETEPLALANLARILLQPE